MSMKSIALSVAAVAALVAQPVLAQPSQTPTPPPGTVLGMSTGVVAAGSLAALIIVDATKTTNTTTGTTGTTGTTN